MSEIETKICKACYKDIDCRAKKCPYCHHTQSFFAVISLRPGILIAFAGVCAVYFVLVLLSTEMFDKGEAYPNYKDQVKVARAELKFGENTHGPTVSIIGTVKNYCFVSWEDIHFEVQFFDKEGNLTDSGDVKKYSMVIPANSERSFKVSLQREFPESEYVTYKASITHAEDVSGAF